MICYLFGNAKDAQKDPKFIFDVLRMYTRQYRGKYEWAFQEWHEGYILASKDTISVLKNISSYKVDIAESGSVIIFGFIVIERNNIPFGIVDIR